MRELANFLNMPDDCIMKHLLLALLLLGCAQTKKKTPTENLVLIQGVHLDASVWNQVKVRLSANSMNVSDLGRIGRDEPEAASLKHISEESCKKIPEKSILVAHSYGGAIANAMVGNCAAKIKKIIYVSALVPANGEKPFDLMTKTDKMNYSKIVTFGKFKIIPKEARTFFSNSDAMIPSDATLPSLYPEWLSLGAEDVTFDEQVYNTIPKAYIYTEKDIVVGLTTQFQYTSRNSIRNSDGIPTGHFPMVSNPERLSQLILKWVKQAN